MATPNNNWRSTPWEMTREKFEQYADDNTAIILRLPLHVKRATAGFDFDLETELPVSSVPKKTRHRPRKYTKLKLKMKHIPEYEPFERLTAGTSLNIYFPDYDKLTIPLVRIVSALELSSDHKPPKEPPHAYVRRGKLYSLRKGKGFSKLEICMAGLTYDKVRRSIPVHKRRRSVYQRNVDKLKEFYSSCLI